MAGSWKNNLIWTNTNDFSSNANFRAQSITVVASADTWSLVLSDRKGNRCFRVDSSIANDRTFHAYFGGQGRTFDGLVITTWTNIAEFFMDIVPGGLGGGEE